MLVRKCANKELRFDESHRFLEPRESDLADELPSPNILAADLTLLNAECSTRVTALPNLQPPKAVATSIPTEYLHRSQHSPT